MDYEARLRRFITEAREQDITHFAFGDLFLEDIRAYREQQLVNSGIAPLFPLWGPARATPNLARTMLAAGLQAILTCVDPRQLGESFVGREFDAGLLADLPASVDPCGERGEFHTFCYAGPMFSSPIQVVPGERLVREGFPFADLLTSPTPSCRSSPASP